jgi:hypothetical protein
MKKYLKVLVLIGLVSFSSQAQGLEDIFNAKDDASKYVENYMAPAMNGLMYNLNNAWYTTGKVHEKFGFDLTISLAVAKIPDSEKTFHFDPADYHYLTLQSGGTAELPTFAGGNTDEVIDATYEGDTAHFDAVDGVGEEWPEELIIPVSIPTPMVQIGLGLPSKTDVKLRFYPKSTTEGVEYSLFGLGLQHDLTQYFKVIDSIPGLTISALGAFTKSNVAVAYEAEADVDSKLEMGINAYTVQLIGDYNLKFINFYLGTGYSGGATSLDVKGEYEYDSNENGTIEEDEIVKDPVSLDFAVAGFKTTIGTRFNLGPVKVFGDYTIQKYPAVTLGLALSIK